MSATLTPDNFSDFFVTTLAQPLTSSTATTGTLANATGAPALPFYSTFGADQAAPELVQVTGLTGTSITSMVRNADGKGNNQAWAAGTSVIQAPVKAHFDNLWNAVSAVNTSLATINLYNLKDAGAKGDGVTNDTSRISALLATLPASNFTLVIPPGTYVVDGNLLLQGKSNFSVLGYGASLALTQAGYTHDVFAITDSHDFSVEGLTLDGMRDTHAPLTVLSANATSGQPSVSVAAGSGANYFAGQVLHVYGGLYANGGTQATNTLGADAGLNEQRTIQSITAGGGAGGGDLITFTANLTNSYTAASGVLSDSYGPYAAVGAYLTPYQTGAGVALAGRSLSGEDCQNGLHLISCQRFNLLGVAARNVWESPIKLGTGFETSTLTDGCSYGSLTDCRGYHGYDQGISVWLSDHITVKGCTSDSGGWAGISLTYSEDCVVEGNTINAPTYRVPGDSNSGSGVAIEGGARNRVAHNTIAAPWGHGMHFAVSPMSFGVNVAAPPTLGAALAGGTAAGTSVLVSSSTALQVGATYSIVDVERTEAVKIASVVDGTHVTFSKSTRFPHVAGVAITSRVPEDNVLANNTIIDVQAGSGIQVQQAVRCEIVDNTIARCGVYASNLLSYGIQLSQNAWGNQTIGGEGSLVARNLVGGAWNESIYVDTVDHVQVLDNEVLPPRGSGTVAAHFKGLRDARISGNHVHDNGLQGGIKLEDGGGSKQPRRVTLAHNIVSKCANEGIIILDGDQLTIEGNTVWSCGGNAGIDLRSVSHSTIKANVCTSNSNTGIKLENNTNGCTYNVVAGNVCREDGTGVNVNTGAAQTQAHGIVESGLSDYNLIINNQSDSNTADQITWVGTHSIVRGNRGVNPVTLTSPAVPASGTPQTNTYGVDAMVYVAGGTVSAIAVDGVATGLTSGGVRVLAGSSVTVDYTAAPTWVWKGE